MILCAKCGRPFAASADGARYCPECARDENLSRDDAASLSFREPPATDNLVFANETPPDGWHPNDAATHVDQPNRLRTLAQSPTLILIAFNLLIFVVMAAIGHSVLDFELPLIEPLANDGARTTSGEWWRLLSSTFVHGGLLHVVLNMWCLYNLGWLAEFLFGRARYTMLYLLCGIGGSLASVIWRPNGLSVGASGAIFGLAGALIPAMLLHANRQVRHLLRQQLISVVLFVFYNIAIGAASRHIDNAAHIGGLLTGLVLGTAFPTGAVRRSRAGRVRVCVAVLAVLALFVGLAAFAQRRNLPNNEIERAELAYSQGKSAEASARVEHALQLQPENPRALFLRGDLRLTAHQPQEAANDFAAVTRLAPDFAPAWVNLCEAERQEGRLPQALEACEQGTQRLPQDANAWFVLGRVRYLLHDVRGAQQALAKAVALNPQGFDENLQYGLLLLTDGQTASALPYLQKAHQLRPNDALVIRLLEEMRR